MLDGSGTLDGPGAVDTISHLASFEGANLVESEGWSFVQLEQGYEFSVDYPVHAFSLEAISVVQQSEATGPPAGTVLTPSPSPVEAPSSSELAVQATPQTAVLFSPWEAVESTDGGLVFSLGEPRSLPVGPGAGFRTPLFRFDASNGAGFAVDADSRPLGTSVFASGDTQQLISSPSSVTDLSLFAVPNWLSHRGAGVALSVALSDTVGDPNAAKLSEISAPQPGIARLPIGPAAPDASTVVAEAAEVVPLAELLAGVRNTDLTPAIRRHVSAAATPADRPPPALASTAAPSLSASIPPAASLPSESARVARAWAFEVATMTPTPPRFTPADAPAASAPVSVTRTVAPAPADLAAPITTAAFDAGTPPPATPTAGPQASADKAAPPPRDADREAIDRDAAFATETFGAAETEPPAGWSIGGGLAASAAALVALERTRHRSRGPRRSPIEKPRRPQSGG